MTIKETCEKSIWKLSVRKLPVESTYGSNAPLTSGCTIVKGTGMGTAGWRNCEGLESLSALRVPSFCLPSCSLVRIAYSV